MKHMSALSAYMHPRIIAVAFLGFSSGLPLALSFWTLTIWLTESGISKSDIGLFALVGTPYVIKFLWSPLIDQMHIPFFTKRLGKRRSWMILSQLCLMIALVGLGATNPTENAWNVALFALLVAICSATQDIVIDAYRIEILDENQQGEGSAALVFGYRMGMLISGGGALFLSEYLGWFITYCIMAALISVGIITVMLTGEPENSKYTDKKADNWADWINKAVIEPFGEFMSRGNWLLILAFIILYKLGDAYAGVMTGPFLIDIGFTKPEIGAVVKSYGLIATLIGAFAGGWLVHKYGMMKSLLLCGFLQMASNLMFVVQAHAGNDIMVLMATISAENFSGGMGTSVFVAYLSSLCNLKYTATQYALFSSFAATGRTWLSSSSGFIVDRFGYIDFFLISTAIALPGIILLIYMGKSLNKKSGLS